MQVWTIFACRINSRHHHTAGNRIHPDDTRYRCHVRCPDQLLC